jgi:putative transposase
MREEVLTPHVAHFVVQAERKMWHHMRHEGEAVPRCTDARLIVQKGMRGVVRWARICRMRRLEASGSKADRLPQFQLRAVRPNKGWMADFTYGATWQGFDYVALAIGELLTHRRVVGAADVAN